MMPEAVKYLVEKCVYLPGNLQNNLVSDKEKLVKDRLAWFDLDSYAILNCERSCARISVAKN